MKRFKFILSVITIIALVFTVTIVNVSAIDSYNGYTIEQIQDDVAFKEIVALKEAIVERVNNTLYTENAEHTFSKDDFDLISVEDIDINNMYKLYISPDIIASNATGSVALTALSSCDYVWVLPVHIENITITITLQRGLPLNESVAYAVDENGDRLLSDASIEKITNQEGKWKIISSCIDYLDTSYSDAVDSFRYSSSRVNISSASTGSTVYFITVPELRTQAAVVLGAETNYIKLFDSSVQHSVTSKSSMDGVVDQKILKELISDNPMTTEYDENGDIIYSGGYVNAGTKTDNDALLSITPLLTTITSVFLLSALVFINVKHLKNKKIHH